MKRLIWPASAVILLVLAACEETGRYPVSGAEYHPDDLVLAMDTGPSSALPVIGGF